MDITIDNEAVRTAISGKIIEALGEEQRTSILHQAVSQLLEEKPSPGYGVGKIPSPIQQAFNNAVRGIAQEVVDDYLAQAEVRASLKAQIAEGTAKFFTDATSSGSLASAIADGIEDVIRTQVYARS